MILLKPQILLKRLAIFKDGRTVYDESFKAGVNILRGMNSSGKSTIVNFIFYALGGDFTAWKPEAQSCDFVMAEIEVNDATITLKREVSHFQRRPMSIYWGAFDEANLSATEGWQVYQFQRSENKESFSQVLFHALGLPEVKSDSESNITIHQLLRLIYVDQLTPVDLLMRLENFDSALTRTTTGDLLLGIYDDLIYSSELKLREKQKELDNVRGQIDSILRVFDDAELEVDIAVLNEKISENQNQQRQVQSGLDQLLQSNTENQNPKSYIQLEMISKELLPLKQKLGAFQDKSERLEFEIEDSIQFILSLEKRISALDDSLITRAALGKLPLNYCPHCLSPLQPPTSENVCVLCKQEISEEVEKSQILRMRQELQLQIKESKKLLMNKENDLLQTRREIPLVSEKVKAIQARYNESMSKVRSSRDEQIDSLFIKKGALESEVEYLHRQAKAVNVLESLKAQKDKLASEIEQLNTSVKTRRSQQERRMQEASTKISNHTINLLRNDLPREEYFKIGNFISVNFSKNTFTFDDRNQFSASSMTYLKNSVHLGIFFASLELDFFRYPRMIICDNIEDKGMEPDRSQNFQRLVVKISQQFDVRHQIIFTTSMIDPLLNNTTLCVGEEYSLTNKSLKFSKA